MRIIFRTDVSAKMGSGHVMRCMALAEKLRENGASVIFISRAHEGNLNHLISKQGFQVLELPKPTSVDINKESTNGNDWEKKFAHM